MTLVRWSPLGLSPMRKFSRVRDDMDRLFDTFLTGSVRGDLPTLFEPPVDIAENADEFVIHADLPGMTLKDIKVQLMGDVLTLRGERRQEKVEKNGNLHRTERIYGSFERTFTLPAPVHADKVKATYRDGVLEVRIPKAEEAKVREIQVQSE